MTTRIGYGITGAILTNISGNVGSGFVVGGSGGGNVDYGQDNAALGILGTQYIPQQWLFTTQAMNWWPSQFVAGDMSAVPAVQDLLAPLYQSIGFNGLTAYGMGAL